MRRRFIYSSELGRLVEVTPFQEEQRAPAVFGDLPDYASPIDGRLVSGRSQRREDLKRHGCRPYEAGETQAAERRRAESDAQLERNVNATIDKWFATSSSRKHELLEQALRGGAGADIVRR